MTLLRTSSFRKPVAAACLMTLAACSSSSHALPAAPVASASTTAAQTQPVTFTIHWTSPTPTSPSKAGKRPAYLPATARSIGIGVDGATPQYLNSPATTLTLSAPAGVDTFSVSSYDEQNGQGDVLSQANITQTIVANTANVLSATLNGVIASVKVALGATFSAGTGGSTSVTVTPYDADGNVIVGPGDYNTPIKLSISDPSNTGTLSLSNALLQTPGQSATLSYTGATLTSASVVASATGITSTNVTVAPTPTIYEYTVSGGSPATIVAGPDGNLWFTDALGNKIGKSTLAGAITEYALPTSNAFPAVITVGNDGNLWFTELMAHKIGKIMTSGTITEYASSVAGDSPSYIADRGDGTMWFDTGTQSDIETQSETTSTHGSFSTVTASATPQGLVRGTDGNMYICENAVGKIEVVTSTGDSEMNVGGNPTDIINGPDGNLWFTDSANDEIESVTPGSVSTLKVYHVPTLSAQPTMLTVGGDGALWFTESNANKIGRVTTSGSFTEYTIPTASTHPGGIASASDGSIWFAEENAGKLGRLVY